MNTHTPTREIRRTSRLRASLVMMAAVVTLGGTAACAPPSGPAGPGGIDINFGPLTIPLPPIEIRPPATNIPLGPCSASYRPPGVLIRNATVTIPGIRVDPNQSIITVPNVVVRIPQLRVPLSTVTLSCTVLGIPLPVQVTVQPDLIIPNTVKIQAATLNLTARTITLQNPSMTINGAGIGIAALGDLIVPLPGLITVPLPTTAIGF